LETTGRLSGSRTARTSTLFSVSLGVGMACSGYRCYVRAARGSSSKTAAAMQRIICGT
jgi:hypothetical protein